MKRKNKNIFIYTDFDRMLLLLLGLLIFGLLTGMNIFGLLFRILLLFLLLSFGWYLIKGGFYILVFFAIVYAGIKGIKYLRDYVKGNDKSEYKESKNVSFDDADFVEVVE